MVSMSRYETIAYRQIKKKHNKEEVTQRGVGVDRFGNSGQVGGERASGGGGRRGRRRCGRSRRHGRRSAS